MIERQSWNRRGRNARNELPTTRASPGKGRAEDETQMGERDTTAAQAAVPVPPVREVVGLAISEAPLERREFEFEKSHSALDIPHTQQQNQRAPSSSAM